MHTNPRSARASPWRRAAVGPPGQAARRPSVRRRRTVRHRRGAGASLVAKMERRAVGSSLRGGWRGSLPSRSGGRGSRGQWSRGSRGSRSNAIPDGQRMRGSPGAPRGSGRACTGRALTSHRGSGARARSTARTPDCGAPSGHPCSRSRGAGGLGSSGSPAGFARRGGDGCPSADSRSRARSTDPPPSRGAGGGQRGRW